MEPLNAEKITALLCDAECAVTVYDALDSTSSECRRRLEAGEGRCLVLAERQTAGRGRQGRDFFSPVGRGLYFSLLLSTVGGIAAADGFTAYAAVCVRRAVRECCGIDCGIKWVNDLYLGDKKVCGILTEAVGDALIVGIGIDILPGELPAELTDTAGALGVDCDRNALCAAIVNGLLAWDGGDRGFMEEYRAASIVLGREIAFLQNGEERRGIARDLAPDGGLVVETGGRLCRLDSGEVYLIKDSLFADNR